MILLNYGKEYYYSRQYIKKHKNITIPKTEHNIEFTKLFTYWDLKLIEVNYPATASRITGLLDKRSLSSPD
jgi:hypothetical protein